MAEKLGPRRTVIFRVSFTPEMGERIERIAGDSDLYASTLIREVVEVYVIEQEGRRGGIEDDVVKANSDKLRGELIKLNGEIMSLIGHRETIQTRLKVAASREEDDDNDEDD